MRLYFLLFLYIYHHCGVPVDYTYNNYQFKVFIERTSISTDIAVHLGDNRKSPKHCIHLTIHRNDDPSMRTAFLNNSILSRLFKNWIILEVEVYWLNLRSIY